MTTFASPGVDPSSSVWELVSNTDIFRSPFNGAIQSKDHGGEFWRVRLGYQLVSGDDKDDLEGLIMDLGGHQHRVTLRDTSRTQLGTFGGTPLVSGANQTGTSINIDGCTASVTNWIQKGDWFSVNGELKKCSANASSDGTGAITVTFKPRLRSAPADNAAITTTNAVGTFLLENNAQGWSNQAGGYGNVSLIFVEDIAA